MDLEELIAHMNITTFLREFTFVDLVHKFDGQHETELCDGLVMLDDFILAFQLKQRDTSAEDLANEQKWFTNKVKKKAVRQMKATIDGLMRFGGAGLMNAAGRTVPLPGALDGYEAKYVIIFDNGRIKGKVARHHKSESTDMFVHIFEISEWRDMVQAMVTPIEISTYLAYRQKVLQVARDHDELSEQALLGGFFGNEPFPREHSRHRYNKVVAAAPDLDISIILASMADRIYEHDRALFDGLGDMEHASNDYYPILAELAKMHRSELLSFRRMWAESWQAIGEFPPRRLHFPPSPRSFVFMTATPDNASRRLTYLNNITLAAKYTTRTDTCIGMCFLAAGNGEVTVDWMMASAPWVSQPDVEEFIKQNNPFPSSHAWRVPRYPEKSSG